MAGDLDPVHHDEVECGGVGRQRIGCIQLDHGAAARACINGSLTAPSCKS
jgi:hypothetical protein